MKLREERIENKLIFYLEGELVAKEKVSVLSNILAVLDREKGIESLVLEMSKVSYLDSSGLGMLLNLKERLKEVGADLILVGLSDYGKKLLALTHLDKAFVQYGELDELFSDNPKEVGVQEGRIEIPSDLEYVQDVSRRIISVLQKFKIPENLLMDMRLVVEEAVVNAIRHGNQFASDRFVLVEYKVDPSQISISVKDEGEGFDYDSVEGKGLRLIKSIADKVEFSRGGSQITIYKRLK